MIIDAELLLAEEQTLIMTHSDPDVASTNVIDLVAAGANLGEPLTLWIQITTTVVGASSTTQFMLYTDSAVGFGTKELLVQTELIPVGTLVQGYEIAINFVPHNTLRYLRLEYDVGTANTTAGAYSAGILIDRHAGDNVN